MCRLMIAAILVMQIQGGVFAKNDFHYSVDFESDREGFPPKIQVSVAGEVNPHIGGIFKSGPGDTVTVQKGYIDSVNSMAFGTDNVLVCHKTRDIRFYFSIPWDDQPIKGEDMIYLIEWDMMVDSALDTYENVGYIVHDPVNSSIFVFPITHGWYAPDGTSSITLYDYSISEHKVFWVPGRGMPVKFQMLFDMKNWTVDLYIKGDKIGTFPCNPAATGIGLLQINPYQTVTSTVAFDNIYLGKIPTDCQEVVLAGKAMQVDMNQDCHIDLNDFMVFAQDWLSCNEVIDVICP